MSASESHVQVPGFRDRLGERIVVPQPSGTLLEHLYFCDALAFSPFFAQALKDRVARLANFTPSAYCRVRRVQQSADGRPILVSAHVAGRRLSEILEVAARSDLKPATPGVLAITRQLMASVALLHDFAPDGYHGALGVDRLILAGDGRIVIAEHVLGTAVEQAVSAWGRPRLWREFRVATLPDPASAQNSRRNDVLQVGIITLSMMLGSRLDGAEYPDDLPRLIHQATETKTDGAAVPIRAGLRTWLERTLGLRGESSYRSLLESQKALAQLLHDDGYGASSVAWDAFVSICETAVHKVPVVVVAPEPAETATGPDVAPPVAAEVVAAPAEPVPVAPVEATEESSPLVKAIEAYEPPQAGVEPVEALREDPFGPWPVAVPSEREETLMEAFLAETAPADSACAGEASADDWAPKMRAAVRPAAAPVSPPPAPEPPPPEPTPLEIPRTEPAPVVTAPAAVHLPPPIRWDESDASEPRATSVADWHAPEHAPGPDIVILHDEAPSMEATPQVEVRREPRPKMRVPASRLLVLAALVLLGTAAAVYAPRLWTLMIEGTRAFGQVAVESNPPGAVVTVDSQVRGHTPLELTLRAGEHLLEVQTGGSAKSKKIVLKAGEKLTERMTFPEAGARGGLRITTYPTTGRVTIDGVPRGETPVKVTDLTPGTHTLLVETPLGAQEQDVVVQPGRVSQLAVPTASWVKVTAPYELKVSEGGRQLGTTGSAPVMLSPGRHQLEFTNAALGLKLRQYVDAAPGQVVIPPIELPVGMMNLFADQVAEVYVDGKKIGDTPLASFPAPLGSHEVVFRHPKYGEVRYTVSVTLASPVHLNVTFRK